MNVKQAITKRRSIRKYKNKTVPDKLIRELIAAARLAPSGHNTQPWRFFIIKDKTTREKLKEENIFKQEFVYSAPLIIVCCSDPKVYSKKEIILNYYDDPNKLRAVRDLALASQNLTLRAVELGLGTCYIGWTHKIKIKNILKIPKHYIIPYVITIGYPAEKPKPRPRKSINEIVLSKNII